MLIQRAELSPPGTISVNPWSRQSIGVELRASITGVPASNNWIAVGLVVFVPFYVPEPMTVTNMWWMNGTAVAGNIDVGIYATDQTLLVSAGSTAQINASRNQNVNVTDTTLARGIYYMAMVSDTSGATQKVIAALPAAGIPQSFGLLEQASVTLPLSTGASPATFAKYTRAFVPFFGLIGYRTTGA